jgi:hypothetical protein
MKIAYIILAHSNINHIKRLVGSLNDEHSTFVIHFDKNSSKKEFSRLKTYFLDYQNIHFTKRIKCYWGDFSLVRATLECIKHLFDRDVDFDYCILLSGADYPLVNKEEIKKFFMENNGKQYIQYFNPSDVWGSDDRTDYFHFNKHCYSKKKSLINYIITKFQLILKKINLKRNSRPFKQFYGGGQWWCLSKDCLLYILDFTNKHKKSVSFFKRVHIPDELFFQTILVNSHYNNQIVNNNLRYIDWSAIPAPKILGVDDFQSIINSKKLFARKFNNNVDGKIISMIDKFIQINK